MVITAHLSTAGVNGLARMGRTVDASTLLHAAATDLRLALVVAGWSTRGLRRAAHHEQVRTWLATHLDPAARPRLQAMDVSAAVDVELDPYEASQWLYTHDRPTFVEAVFERAGSVVVTGFMSGQVRSVRAVSEDLRALCGAPSCREHLQEHLAHRKTSTPPRTDAVSARAASPEPVLLRRAAQEEFRARALHSCTTLAREVASAGALTAWDLCGLAPFLLTAHGDRTSVSVPEAALFCGAGLLPQQVLSVQEASCAHPPDTEGRGGRWSRVMGLMWLRGLGGLAAGQGTPPAPSPRP